ncbi:Concanavalin A-like lectin/glucanases superfamily protein [Roseivivax lentus]|uniref:Concanavalin A-like lectin/glucanases superfamily protein n=1 Tax=Roseivivax lentus TaxID=633194 RepID=A0A1N7KT26_9RHOB|nr:LamG-like jellyroll fold domain-containing protein [Roseivivax lentus]SIS64646.1 Concanavalin A-like lectin/glucanases superfamily protein [Roseivivax lentus]
MATLVFQGTSVAAVGSANDDGSGGVDLILDQTQDLDGNGAQEGLRLYVQNGVLYASIIDRYSAQTSNTGVSVVRTCERQQVAVTFGNGNLTLFQNGLQMAQVSSTLSRTGNSAELWIGARHDGNWNETHLDGRIDEVAIDDRRGGIPS